MKRAHQLPFAKDIAFVDSTSSCDIQSHSVTFMLAPCGVGAVPLGIFITKGQSTEDYKAAFALLKQSMPNGFNDQGFPKQFVIDDSEAEKQALQSIWPESKINLCRFHILQSVWRWLWDTNHDVLKDDRKILFKLFHRILIATSLHSAEEAYMTAIGQISTEYSCINNTVIPLKYEKWIKYVNNYWKRKELWCLVFRDASVHGHQTNNFSEVNVRIFKDIVLSRNKAYNAVALVDFICTALEEYYLRRLRTFVNGRNDTARHIFEDQLKRATNIQKESIHKLSEHMYRVQSETENTFYEVDVTNGFCSCPKGKLGAFCKHQAAIYHHHEMNMPSLPAINTESRYLLAKLAFGENVRDKSFYMPLTSESNIKNNDTTLEEGKDLHHQNNDQPHCLISQTDTNNSNNDLENTSAHDYSKEIQSLLTTNLNKYKNTVSTSVLSKCLDRLKKVKSPAMWESFLSTAGSKISLRHRSRATIHVQPTTLARRRSGVTRGSKRLSVGRPKNNDPPKKKRRRNLAENVEKNIPNAKSHGVGH